MPKYAVAFILPTDGNQLSHKVVESDSKENALRKFFNEEVSEYYSNDEQGFHYFKEDFNLDSSPAGSIIELQ